MTKPQPRNALLPQDDGDGDFWKPTARVSEIAHRLVGWKSETGTVGEAEFAERLRGLLLEIPYFDANPGDILLCDSHGAPMTRNLVAIVRGAGERSLALTGHFDTASVDNYHELEPLACSPGPLSSALLSEMSARTLSDQEARAFDDLASGEFIPGRGMLDMKSGLAAAIAVLERFAATRERLGNLILLATPDEERESRGMRALREDLPALMRDRDLDIAAAINMDVTSDPGDGSLGRAVYEGTIGKLLPFAYVIGQPSHAAYPFEGMSAQLIGAEILRGIEGNPALADTAAGDISPPPICLEARDTRDGYEVTTPERFWLSFNWLYHSGSAAERFGMFKAEVEAGLARAAACFAARASEFAELTRTVPGASGAAPRVLTLAELRRETLRDPALAQAYAAEETALAGIDNPLLLSRKLTDWLIAEARIKGPTVVIGLAGLHYPPSRLDPKAPQDAALLEAIRSTKAAFAQSCDTRLSRRLHFQGISDMSFLGRPAQEGADVVAENTPSARLVDRPGKDAPVFPSVNIGPWGREFHQRLERVYAPYAFDALPRIIAFLVERFFDPPDRAAWRSGAHPRQGD